LWEPFWVMELQEFIFFSVSQEGTKENLIISRRGERRKQ